MNLTQSRKAAKKRIKPDRPLCVFAPLREISSAIPHLASPRRPRYDAGDPGELFDRERS
jgi:hypothetical protein